MDASLLWPAAFLCAGLLLLFLGGDWLVRGSVAVARALSVSPFVIGLTLVGFGTSMPELFTSVQAGLLGSPGIAVGNVIGSNSANILLILGLAALLAPLSASPAGLRRDGLILAVATAVGAAVLLQGTIGRLTGAAFLLLLGLYVAGSYALDRKAGRTAPAADMHLQEAASVPLARRPLLLSLGLALLGLAVTILGARLLVDGALDIGRGIGISEAVLGVTIVAVGTSLPELATSIAASLKREADIAVANIIGSNIFNLIGILGATALVTPIAVPAELLGLDLWVMVGATALMLALFLTRAHLHRREGGLFLVGYAAYIATLLLR